RVVSREGQPVRVIGAGRTHQSTADFRAMVKETSQSERLSASAEWVQLDYSDPATFTSLKEQLTGSQTVIFYLATPPETFGDILAGLTLSGLATRADATRRIVVEKPLGHNLPSAHRINAQLAEAFDEEQIFRIDHYLAKDTVQNVLALRFSNSLFEPVWNRTLIETILITVEEEEGIGKRAGYYDQTGAVRDIIQNHVLQLLALITMEPPTTFDADYVRRAKRAALRAMLPLDPGMAVRGQCEGYRDEGITIRIGAKRPGTRFEMVPAGMRLDYAHLTKAALPDAYENVLSEVLAGGNTAFPGAEEIELAWEIVDPLVRAWEGEGHPESYPRGSWGPHAADDLVATGAGGRWIVSGDEPGTG